ncbi:MAG: M23 family metallopeptidase [Patescibacteria group bacterium]|jgi:murein DD-endopeptidase MepM/ murein hydrolase activator NlpD
MKRILWILGLAVCVMAMFWVAGCDKTESPVEPTDEVVVDQPGDDGAQAEKGYPSRWPTSMSHFKFPFSGVMDDYWHGQTWRITCGYGCGYHRNTYYPPAGYYSIDLIRSDSASAGSWVLNPARGKVAFAGWMTSYGWCVVMNHDAGHTGQGYTSIVAHLQSNPNDYVSEGNDLLQGTVLGKCGGSGGDWPAHIHFSIWKHNVSVPLNGISGGGALEVGGSYCSGNALIRPPKGW